MKFLPALAILCASLCAPALAATPGSKVAVQPLVAQSASKVSAKPLTIRLPMQAGNVSKVIATNLVTKGPSWIAIGDKYISLCAPNRRMVSCAPIVATEVMRGIEVGAAVGKNGEPLIRFKIDDKITPKRAAYAVNYFLGRTKKVVAHFDRMTVSYAPQQNSLMVGQSVDEIAVGGSSGCTYDDEGNLSCTGGSSDSGGESVPGAPAIPCGTVCNYPPNENNGNGDPCIAPDGSRICASESEIPSVPVIGQRPPGEEPTPMSGCRPIGPGVFECGGVPPVVGGAPEMPPHSQPWFSQSWCNAFHVLCSAGQYPDNHRGKNSSTSGKTKDELYTVCEEIEEVERDVCRANRGGMDSRSLSVCMDKAQTRKLTCYETARTLTDDGAHVAP